MFGLYSVASSLILSRGHLPQRRHVENPQAAAVRGGDDLAGRRVNGDFVDRHRRQVVVDLRPRTAAIERREQRELGAAVEQIRVLDVLAQTARRAGRAGCP